MIHLKKLLLLSALTVCSGLVTAQTNGSNSPYSRYGFGLLNDRAQGFNKGMSGLAYGMRNGKELNAKNPASYSSIDSLSFIFDIGLSLQNGNLEQNGRKVNAHNTSVDYVSMGFRVSPRLGMSVGLMPFSTIGYSMSDSKGMDLPTGEVTQTMRYSGDGGLHEVYAGLGWQPLRNFSIGANVGYLWGNVSNTVLASFSDASIASTRRFYDADIRTYKIDLGLQYEFGLDRNNRLTAGITYGLGHEIGSTAYFYNQKITSGSVSGADTLATSNAFQLPHTFGAGLVWTHKGNLRIGADYQLQKWSGVTMPTVEVQNGEYQYVARKGSYTDLHKITVGGEYIPNPNGVRWRDFVRYRAGFSYSTPYTKVDGKDGPRDYCVSLGVGLPVINFHNNRSIVNISAQYERVKPKFAGMITENYLRLCIGLSFNERWFMKWKVE